MLVAVWFILYRTRLGLAIRATANDLEVANLMGMNVNRVAMATVAISVALAAIAGVVVAPVYVVDPFMWLAPLVTMLAIVVLGGLGSLKGSLIGALIIGYVEAITVFARARRRLPQGRGGAAHHGGGAAGAARRACSASPSRRSADVLAAPRRGPS